MPNAAGGCDTPAGKKANDLERSSRLKVDIYGSFWTATNTLGITTQRGSSSICRIRRTLAVIGRRKRDELCQKNLIAALLHGIVRRAWGRCATEWSSIHAKCAAMIVAPNAAIRAAKRTQFVKTVWMQVTRTAIVNHATNSYDERYPPRRRFCTKRLKTLESARGFLP
jgi:hypothetical protein